VPPGSPDGGAAGAAGGDDAGGAGRDQHAEGDRDEQREAEAGRLGGEPDRRRAGQGAEVGEAGHPGDADPARAAEVAGGAEGDRDHRGQAGTEQAEPGHRDQLVASDHAHAEPAGGDQAAVTDQADRTEPAGEPVPDQAAGGHAQRERGEPGRRRPWARAKLPQVQGAPVRGGALGEEGAEADQSEQEHRPPPPAGGTARAERLVAALGWNRDGVDLGREQLAGGDRRHRAEHDRGHGEVQQGIPAGTRRQAGGGRADQPADAPHAVQPGHDRPAAALLDDHAVGVHRRVEQADADPEQAEAHQQRRQVPGQRRSEQQGRVREGRHPGDRPAAVAGQQRADELHGDQRAGGDAQQGDPERPFGQAEAFLDRRDARYPGGDRRAVDEEDQRGAGMGAA
jgi:hypothetical protein